MKLTIISTMSFAFLIACGEEKNPYKDRYYQKGGTLPSTGDGTAATGPGGTVANPAPGQGVPAVGADAGPAPVSNADTMTAAKPENIAKETLSATQIVCQSQAATPKYATELAVLCLNGQPTTAFANLLATPFKGTGRAAVSKIKSVDNAGVSDFLFATSSEIPVPLATAIGKRAQLGVWTFTEGNANFTGTRVADLAPMGTGSMGGFETKDSLVVTVTIITIRDERVMQSNWLTLKEGMVVSTQISLKAGAPENADNTVANILTFMISEGTSTKMVAVTRQEVANRGQHAQAETTALAVAGRIAEEGYKILAN